MTINVTQRLLEQIVKSKLLLKRLLVDKHLPQCSCLSTTAKYIKPRKSKGTTDRKERHFVDYAEIEVCAGKGGNGMLSFLSLPHHEWAGPDGGDGGNGGHVIFKVNHNVKSLAHLKKLEKANDGVKGKTKQRHGKNAEHKYIEVPRGTVVRSTDGSLLASLDTDDDLYIAARGGAGGKGNHFFLTNENRAPAVAELGADGQSRVVSVELKTMAHFGLVGFPNAGKSTLLRAISRARPAVSAFPFTTVNPHVGMLLYDDHQQVAVADIPGLIPGAHLNKGLGHDFLRHVERCLCLVYVLDGASGNVTPLEQLACLRSELELYQPGLSQRPAMVVLNKIDLREAQAGLQQLRLNLPRDWVVKRSVTASSGVGFTAQASDENLRLGSVSGSENFYITPDQLSERRVDEGSLGEKNESEEIRVTKEEMTSIQKEESHGDDGSYLPVNVIGVSAKKSIGIEKLLHHLRVAYDKYNKSLETSSEL